jgi:hypothetical protein
MCVVAALVYSILEPNLTVDFAGSLGSFGLNKRFLFSDVKPKKWLKGSTFTNHQSFTNSFMKFTGSLRF